MTIALGLKWKGYFFECFFEELNSELSLRQDCSPFSDLLRGRELHYVVTTFWSVRILRALMLPYTFSLFVVLRAVLEGWGFFDFLGFVFLWELSCVVSLPSALKNEKFILSVSSPNVFSASGWLKFHKQIKWCGLLALFVGTSCKQLRPLSLGLCASVRVFRCDDFSSWLGVHQRQMWRSTKRGECLSLLRRLPVQGRLLYQLPSGLQRYMLLDNLERLSTGHAPRYLELSGCNI